MPSPGRLAVYIEWGKRFDPNLTVMAVVPTRCVATANGFAIDGKLFPLARKRELEL
jgi:hypothetical protein